MLLRQFPDLKIVGGDVSRILDTRRASSTAIQFWQQIVEQDLTEDDDDDLNF